MLINVFFVISVWKWSNLQTELWDSTIANAVWCFYSLRIKRIFQNVHNAHSLSGSQNHETKCIIGIKYHTPCVMCNEGTTTRNIYLSISVWRMTRKTIIKQLKNGNIGTPVGGWFRGIPLKCDIDWIHEEKNSSVTLSVKFP